MNRSILTLTVASLVLIGTHADEPKGKTDVKPPYERLLQGEDAKKAAEAHQKVQ